MSKTIVTADLLLVFGLGLSVLDCQVAFCRQNAPQEMVGSALRTRAKLVCCSGNSQEPDR